MKLTAGRKISVEVETIADAVKHYNTARECHLYDGNRGSDWPMGVITDGKKKYWISFNGRVWDGNPARTEPNEVKY